MHINVAGLIAYASYLVVIRFHMKGQCVISCGLIQMIGVVGESHLEGLVIPLDRI